MYYKRTFLLYLSISSFLVSCTKDLFNKTFGSCEIWRTNNTDFKLLSDSYNSAGVNYLIPYSFVILNSGYSILSAQREKSQGNIYVSEIYPINGSKYPIGFYNFFLHLEEETNSIILSKESITPSALEKEVKDIICKNETIKPFSEDMYLINSCYIYLKNNDIDLLSTESQLSFLTGRMKKSSNEYVNVILKSTSNTTFKIYEFIGKKEVGNLLLEGDLSPIKKKENNWEITLEVKKDYKFENKYQNQTLEVKYPDSELFEKLEINKDFYFPEDID